MLPSDALVLDETLEFSLLGLVVDWGHHFQVAGVLLEGTGLAVFLP